MGPGSVTVNGGDAAPGHHRRFLYQTPTQAYRVNSHEVKLNVLRTCISVQGVRATTRSVALASALGSLLGGCAAFERLRFIGDPPPLAAISNPTTQPGYKPVQMPMPAPQPAVYQPNSLWRTGSRAFFKDQRAHQVGDILTVKVKITDKASLENETARSRKAPRDFGHRRTSSANPRYR